MIVNTAKQRMLGGQPALGAGVGLGAPTSAALLAQAGFDFILVDYQHGEWDDATALAAFRAISLQNAIPMARVRQNDFYTIGRVLDRGALGIVVPMVNSAADAQAAAHAVRYPPQGGRSFGGSLAIQYGPDFDTWINREIFLAVQIESAQAVAQAEQILAVEGVDGCWIGPNDLARSLGVAQNTPTHTEAILSAIAACRRARKIPGISAADAADAQRWIEHGCLFVTAGNDAAMVVGGGRETLRHLGRQP
jgi:4-hydroxy-2-oxoheptanedioate aldolase